MRWGPILVGLGMLAASTGISVAVWETLLNPRVVEKVGRLNVGMTVREVEAIFGGEGTSQVRYISGDLRWWKEVGFPKTYRWEDVYTTIDITFQGPRGTTPALVEFRLARKDQPDLTGLWVSRIGLPLLALGGFGLLIFGLCSRPVKPAVDTVPSSATPA